MATNNSTSLYSFNSNVKVSPNNFTTLYNSNPSTIVSKDVSDSNFTTLYTQQTTTTATRPYGNANVEAFLNSGVDAGGNQVQNIHMSGNLFVGGQSYLGNVENVHITGGSFNYVLTTNGAGNLSWEENQVGANTAEFIHFDVNTTANNQQFTSSDLNVYASNNSINLFKNGVNIEPFYFEKTANDTVQVNLLLNAGDTIDILASTTGAIVGGANTEVQFNLNGTFAGSNNFTYNGTSDLLTVGTISLSTGIANTILYNDNIGNVNYGRGFVVNPILFALDAANGYYTGTIANNSSLALWFSTTIESDAFIAENPSIIIINDFDITGNVWYVPQITNVFYPFPGTPYVQIVHGAGVVNQGAAIGYTYVTLSEAKLTPTSLTANLVDVSIAGGNVGYVLSTDGFGTLSWIAGGGGNGAAVGGGNAIQFANATTPSSFDGSQDFTYKFEMSTVIDTPHIHITSDTDPNVGYPDFSVITFDRDGLIGSGYGKIDAGYLDFTIQDSERHSVNGFEMQGPNSLVTPVSINMAGNISFNEAWSNTFAPAYVNLGNVDYLTIIGGAANSVLVTDGSNNLSFTDSLNVSNITTTGNLIIQRAYEKYVTVASGTTGTINFDALDQSILYYTANSTANFTLNVRGNSTTSLNSILPSGDTLTIAFLNTVGATSYVINSFTIDGTSVSPKYVNGNAPTVGSHLVDSTHSYTYTIMKSAANTYTVLGSLTEYK